MRNQKYKINMYNSTRKPQHEFKFKFLKDFTSDIYYFKTTSLKSIVRTIFPPKTTVPVNNNETIVCSPFVYNGISYNQAKYISSKYIGISTPWWKRCISCFYKKYKK